MAEHVQSDNDRDNEGRTVEGIEGKVEFHGDELVIEEGILSGEKPKLGSVFVVVPQLKDLETGVPYSDDCTGSNTPISTRRRSSFLKVSLFMRGTG